MIPIANPFIYPLESSTAFEIYCEIAGSLNTNPLNLKIS
jgi:hypothetical protein